ncbi:MAG: CCA tRNA nucleotidyltransferase [Alphaproteobacteria bacterium]|nr:CCA tRNA nucleotidyltransferase [Alphaproteobacteria bacterium]
MPKINPAWLRRADVVRVLTILNDAPLNDERAITRCVGGCVRDTLLGADNINTEVDMATTLTPEQVQTRLTKAGITNKPIGIEHGTIFAFTGGHTIEITTLRRDVKTDGRHAKVAFTDDWVADAKRRDFTINALYADADGTLYDFNGTGEADIKNKSVRFIGNAETRIKEDYLRILRFVRFHFTFAPKGAPHGWIDETGLLACRLSAEKIDSLSGERKRDEFFKILELPNADAAVNFLSTIDATQHLIECDKALVDTNRLMHLLQRKDNEGANALVRLACLLPDVETAEKTADNLKLSKAEKKYLCGICMDIDLDFYNLPEEKLYAAFYWSGVNVVSMNALAKRPQKYDELKRYVDAWQKPIFPINGERLKAEGMQAGKEMGDFLKSLEQWWVGEGFPEKDILEAELQKRLGRLDKTP